MIEELLQKEEGKTLEFKENTKTLNRIIQTIIAFANTSGGIILIGIKDGSKEVVGLKNIQKEEERISNAVSDSIFPVILPNFRFCSWRKKDILIIDIPYSIGPYYLKSKGPKNSIFIRLGSTNRIADDFFIDDINRAKKHISFDELPNYDLKIKDFDFSQIEKAFKEEGKIITQQKALSLGLFVKHQNKLLLSNAAILLFEKNRTHFFPDSKIRLGRFKGKTKSHIIDQVEVSAILPDCIDECLYFVERHTSTLAEFGKSKRKDIHEYPPIIVREAITNAIVHADYSLTGSNIQLAIYDDRLEITNPGGLPLGLRLETALLGISQLRNKIIGRIFKEFKIIEQWGSGFGRMIDTCLSQNIKPPKIEEIDKFFRVTLYPRHLSTKPAFPWQEKMINYLRKNRKISAKKAQQVWHVTARTTSTRLKKMCELGLLKQIATNPYDPQKYFTLPT